MKKHSCIRRLSVALALALCGLALNTDAQPLQAYYIDGYHGGVWGHYPDWNTAFMVDQLEKHPDWKINIEIEPETWDRAERVDPQAYEKFKALIADQGLNGRIEYVNPAYAQSYTYTILGESTIRQFQYGMQKIRAHFPQVVFATYSSEEPCFTSALPQILRSFGFSYASLKNPNTCFGGYVSAHGGELVNWTGPDGTAILASPRYAVEKLARNSTWQTIAWNNGPGYVTSAYADGILHPIGMTLQDAGWKGGPFLGDGDHGNVHSIYTTWRNYFSNVVKGDPAPAWKLSQEDIQVSLVWGSQVTQQIAQRVRAAENTLLQTEKLAALAKVYGKTDWPQQAFDQAWRTLLLSQHHDCWIVPYNGKPGDTWADKVQHWTGFTISECDSVRQASASVFGQQKGSLNGFTVVNTMGVNRKEAVLAELPQQWQGKAFGITDGRGGAVPMQVLPASGEHAAQVLFLADVPAMGSAGYRITNTETAESLTRIEKVSGGYVIESDLYRIRIDTAHGGVIKSLIAKKFGNREFVKPDARLAFNELRGNFYDLGGYHSSTENPVKAELLEKGPVRVKLALKGEIAGQPFIQTISLTAADPKIDFQLHIDWRGNTGIGDPVVPGKYKWELPAKPFYNDSSKLLVLFPLNLDHQRVYKNAPFDVTESRLGNTFFTRWDSIKNNVILNWVDVTDGQGKYGMALLTDHTTSYAHGEDFPLALDVQYSGMGLWGRNYTISGPTAIHYALIPHAGTWDNAGLWLESDKWSEPLVAFASNGALTERSLFRQTGKPVEVTSMQWSGKNLIVRLFNASATGGRVSLVFNENIRHAELVELDGRKEAQLIVKQAKRQRMVTFDVPRFGIRTLRLSGVDERYSKGEIKEL